MTGTSASAGTPPSTRTGGSPSILCHAREQRLCPLVPPACGQHQRLHAQGVRRDPGAPADPRPLRQHEDHYAQRLALFHARDAGAPREAQHALFRLQG